MTKILKKLRNCFIKNRLGLMIPTEKLEFLPDSLPFQWKMNDMSYLRKNPVI